MRLSHLVSQPLRRRSSRRGFARQANACKCVIDQLETRRLFDGETVTGTVAPILASTSSPASNNISLNQYFSDSEIPGTLVQFNTSEGSIYVALTDQATPQTVANFLTYVNSGEYNGTFFHRSVDLNTDLGATPSAPATIIQGGGYNLSNGAPAAIPTNAPVQDEFSTEILHNTADTLAMALSSDPTTGETIPDSGTSEWYFNVSDNTELDNQTTGSTGAPVAYTVFGQVLGQQSVNTINTIAALPTDGYLGGAFTTLPVTGLTEADASANAPFSANDLVYINDVESAPGTSYTVTSDDKALVNPTVSNGVLSFTYGPGSGTAEITVVANNLDGTSASTNISVTVPNAATPSAGPVANAVTAPTVVTGSSESFSALGTDTDSLAGLNPSTVTIVTQPVNGTASVNTSNGYINYTPNAGYVGPDTLTYTVSDDIGNTSAPATVTLDTVPTAVAVTIGVGQKATSLTFTQPDGVVGHLTINNAYAVVTFTTYQVNTSISKGVMTASGPGTTITNINITNIKHEYSKLEVTSNGPVSLGSVDDNYTMTALIAPNGTLTGASRFNNVLNLQVAAADNAFIYLGSGLLSNLYITSATNTSVQGNQIGAIRSQQWINTDGGSYNISATSILTLQTFGMFADNLFLTGTGYDLYLVNLVQADGDWGLSGSIHKAIIDTVGADWQLQSSGLIQSLAIKGNLANDITAAAITSLTVSGTTTNAAIETDSNFSPKYLQISHISFGGAVSGSVVFASGNIGTITAPSFTDTRIYAGVELTEAQSGALADSASNLSNDAKITSISLSARTNSFSNSLINADIIGSLHLGQIETSNGGTTEGVGAHSIGSIAGTLVPGGVLAAGSAQLKSAAALAAYEKAKKLSLGDFAIDLF